MNEDSNGALYVYGFTQAGLVPEAGAATRTFRQPFQCRD
jgi:hypothetical protein